MPDVDPRAYEAWYRTMRGAWIADREFTLLMQLMRPGHHASVLDVGCGTGHFSRRFATAGLHVTGIDSDDAMLAFAREQNSAIVYQCGDAQALPFADCTFDHCVAITSLCFIDDPVRALREMLRVARCSVALGLLNRNSRLYRQKHGRGGYQGARWDSAMDVRQWATVIDPGLQVKTRSAVFFPGGGRAARLAEALLPSCVIQGGFLAASLRRRQKATG